MAQAGHLSPTDPPHDAEDTPGVLGVVARAAGSTSPVPLAPGGPLLLPSLESARAVLTRPEVFTQPFDVSRRPVRRLGGRTVPKDTPVLPATAVARGREVFVAELERAYADLGGPDDPVQETDALVLLRRPVARSTTVALLEGVDPASRDLVADLVVAWVDALGPIISAARPPRRWARPRRAEQQAWRRLLRALADTGADDPAAVATALAAGVQVPIAAGAWCLTLLAADPDLQATLRNRPELAVPFVWEVLRLYPPTWLLARITTREVELAGTTIPAYTPVVVSPVELGRLPHLVPGPAEGHAPHDRIDPTRWVDGGARPGAWLPFGAGPHACPGRNLGLAQLTELVSRSAALELATSTPPRADTDRGLSPTPSAIRARRTPGRA